MQFRARQPSALKLLQPTGLPLDQWWGPRPRGTLYSLSPRPPCDPVTAWLRPGHHWPPRRPLSHGRIAGCARRAPAATVGAPSALSPRTPSRPPPPSVSARSSDTASAVAPTCVPAPAMRASDPRPALTRHPPSRAAPTSPDSVESLSSDEEVRILVSPNGTREAAPPSSADLAATPPPSPIQASVTLPCETFTVSSDAEGACSHVPPSGYVVQRSPPPRRQALPSLPRLGRFPPSHHVRLPYTRARR